MARGVKIAPATIIAPVAPKVLTSVDGIKIGDERQSIHNLTVTGKVTVTGFEETDDSNYGHYVCLVGPEGTGQFRAGLRTFKALYK